MCTSKLNKIMHIKDYKERNVKLNEYASKLGIRTGCLQDPREYISQIREAEKHRTNVILAIIGIVVTVLGIGWGTIYTFWVYPPEYVLSESSLHYEKWFGSWVKQEKKKNKQINPYDKRAEFELHFILRNKHRGEGEVFKPLLVITAENSDKEYIIKPNTSSFSSKKEGDGAISYTTIDLGRTIHVGSYGIVDEFFEYSIGDEEKDREIMEFLRINNDRLRFKIRGYPYGDVDVIFSEEDIQ